MPTQKLFYNDGYATQFTATVQECTAVKDYFAIVLDKTLFYPEGGGQPCDMGTLTFEGGTADVFFTKEKDEIIYHHSHTAIPVGSIVQGKIDFDRRFDLMQQHTGEHMMSGIIHKMFGYTNVGFHLTENDMSIDFDGVLSDEDIAAVVAQANRLIVADQPVTADYPDTEKLEYRSKKPLQGAIRIVTAGDADVCACCGVHVARTSQVQMIAVRDSMNYKGGTRIFFGCGGRVFADYMKKNSLCAQISQHLSAKTDEISTRVADKIKECDNLKIQLGEAKTQLMEYWAEEVQQGEIGFVSRENLVPNELQRLAAQINKKCAVACVYSKQADGTGKICIISQTRDTNLLGRAVCSALGGKGGGKPGIFQGTVTADGDVKAILEGVVYDG